MAPVLPFDAEATSFPLLPPPPQPVTVNVATDTTPISSLPPYHRRALMLMGSSHIGRRPASAPAGRRRM
ncbi:hypothetical protein GCM10010207_41310 [Streptomyces atratus]|nr:hypothetical protein GCM10010207_41310 [Streptomyces atratus]